jgi:hypothetical protein
MATLSEAFDNCCLKENLVQLTILPIKAIDNLAIIDMDLNLGRTVRAQNE